MAPVTTVLMALATRTMSARPMAVPMVRLTAAVPMARATVALADRAVTARPAMARCLTVRV
jgi:hypothetical protein